MSLIPYNPWSLIDWDDLFENRLQKYNEGMACKGAWCPSVDIKSEPNYYLIIVDIPGVDPKNVEISTEDNVLSIKGERDVEKKEEKKGYSRIEREYGSFYRRFTLPEDADVDKIDAHSKHGVLELTIPRKKPSETKKLKKIKIKE